MNKTSKALGFFLAGASLVLAAAAAVTNFEKPVALHAATTYTAVTDLAAGDEVVFAYVNGNTMKEMTGISTTSTTYGLATNFQDTPAGTYRLTVEAGNTDGSFSFKNGTKYLSWSSGNSLTTSTTKNNASSWTIAAVNNSDTVRLCNVGTDSRYLQYNTSSPRFACYANQSNGAITIYKTGETSSNKYTVTYSDGDEGTYLVENINEGNSHSLVDFASTGLSSPDGKMFKCWNVGGVERPVGYSLTVNENTTVTAVFSDKLSIRYKANNGVEPAEDDVVKYFASGTDQTIADNSTTTKFTAPASHIFSGWNTNANGTGTSYAAGSVQDELSSSLELYAQWQKVGPTVSFDLSEVSYNDNPTADLIVWEDNLVTMQNAKGSGTNVTNYIPDSYSSTRFYSGNILTITPTIGYEIISATFTATSTSYATALKNSAWTNASATSEDAVVTVTPTDGTSTFNATIGATCGFTDVTFQFAPLRTFNITSTDDEVEINDIIQVEADVNGVSWSSSDETVATIDEDGYVEGKKIGTVTITGSKAGYEDATITINVIQSSKPYINLSLTVNDVLNQNTGYTGQSFSVSANYGNLASEPDEILWSVSGTGSVTRTQDEAGDIYSGTLTSAGNVRITATDAEGDTTAYVDITITESEITSFTIDKTSLKLFDGDNGTISASVSAIGAYSENVEWSSSNNAVASVVGGVVTANNPGEATITATADDKSTRTCSVTVVGLIDDEIEDAGEPAEVTFTAGTDLGSTSSNNSPDEVVKGGVTIHGTDAAFATAQYRCYKDSETTVSVEGTITRIEISGSDSKNPISNLSANVGTLSQGVWTGSASSVVFTASAQARVDTFEVTYTPVTRYSNSYTYFEAQKAVLEFADYFTTNLNEVCVTADYGSDDFIAQWNLVSNKYDVLFGENSELSSSDLAAAMILIKKATADYNGDTLQKALARYERITSYSNLPDFIVDGSTPLRTRNLNNGPYSDAVTQELTPVATTIVIAASATVIAGAGMLILKRRKEQ